jgi:hypothetical protein
VPTFGFPHSSRDRFYSCLVSKKMVIPLVGGWPTPLKNMTTRQLGWWNYWMESHRIHVPNHQPVPNIALLQSFRVPPKNLLPSWKPLHPYPTRGVERKWALKQLLYTLVICYIPIQSDHRNRWTQLENGDFPVRYVSLPECKSSMLTVFQGVEWDVMGNKWDIFLVDAMGDWTFWGKIPTNPLA